MAAIVPAAAGAIESGVASGIAMAGLSNILGGSEDTNALVRGVDGILAATGTAMTGQQVTPQNVHGAWDYLRGLATHTRGEERHRERVERRESALSLQSRGREHRRRGNQRSDRQLETVRRRLPFTARMNTEHDGGGGASGGGGGSGAQPGPPPSGSSSGGGGGGGWGSWQGHTIPPAPTMPATASVIPPPIVQPQHSDNMALPPDIASAIADEINKRRTYTTFRHGFQDAYGRSPYGARSYGRFLKRATAAQNKKRLAINRGDQYTYLKNGEKRYGYLSANATGTAKKAQEKALGRMAFRKMLGGRNMKRRRPRGRGMYTDGDGVPGNSLISGGGGHLPLQISSANNEHSDIVITHEECIRDVYGCSSTEEEQLVCYNINPGLLQTFPFISKIAQNFENYICEQLIFRYESVLSKRVIVSDGTEPQNGMIYGVGLGPSERVPNTIGEIDDKDQARGVTFDTPRARWGVEAAPQWKENPFWKPIRSGGVDKDASTKDYDMGKFVLAVANTPSAYANKQIGKLKVYARFRLMKIKPLRLFGPQIQCDRYLSSGTISAAHCLGDGYNGTAGKPCGAVQNNIGCALQNAQTYTLNDADDRWQYWTTTSEGTRSHIAHTLTSAQAIFGVTSLASGGAPMQIDNTTTNTDPDAEETSGSYIMIKFPSNAEGCFEIQIRSEVSTSAFPSSNSNRSALIYNINAHGWDTVCATAGKVTPIFDCAVGGSIDDGVLGTAFRAANVPQNSLKSTYFTHSMGTMNEKIIAHGGGGYDNTAEGLYSATTAGYGLRFRMLTIHVRVLPSLNGLENMVAIPWANMGCFLDDDNVTYKQAPWKLTSVDIAEYKIQKDYEMPNYVNETGVPPGHYVPTAPLGQPSTTPSYFKQTINPTLQGNTILVNPTDSSATSQTAFLS